MSLRRTLAALLLLVSTTAGVAAAPPAAPGAADPALLSGLQWRLLGPFRGGRVLAVAGVPGEPAHFYFGSVNGGVWESRDAGRTWQPVFDGQPVGSIGALAVAPSNPRVLYAGTGEADMRSDIAQGNGMYKSSDGGRTWSASGLADSQQIGRVIVHPQNPDVVYVAALGHPYGPNPERGLYRSRDGGRSWVKVLGGAGDSAGDVGAIDVAFEPGNPAVLYAALWQTRRTPWEVYPPSNGPGSGLYKSTDGGDHWTPLAGHGLPAKVGRVGLAVAPSEPRRVYALVDSEDAGGVYRSDDAGATWRLASGDARIWSRGWYFGGITVEPRNPDVVYSANTALYRSADGGKTWVPAKGAPGGDDYHILWIDPQAPERRILGVDQGAVVSVDGGATWSSWFNQPTGQFYHVSTDRRFPYWVYGSQQDSGAAGVPSRTNGYDGINLTQFREVTAGGESDAIAPDPLDPEIIYGGRVDRLDLRTGQTRAIDPTLAYPERYRDAWTLPLAFSPRDPRRLYFANQRLFRTADGGEHWALLSPDLTREDPGKPANLDAGTLAGSQTAPRRGVIYAIAPSRAADGQIWVGTDDGLIWRTKDEGAHWANVTPAGLGAWSKVGILDAGHFDAETVYAAVDRHRLDDFKPYIYRTHDGGASWQLAVSGIADGSFVNAVREDPVTRGLLYAGTETGVYVSFDDGDHWHSLQANLPATSVRDLDVHDNDLVIATHGRGFWVLDDVSPLRQWNGMGERLAGKSGWLLPPAAAVRFRPAGFTGSPMPMDEPRAANPPAGAVLDYVLAVPAKLVTLSIRDAQGGVVRSFASATPVAQPDLGKLAIAPEWVTPAVRLETNPGLHRFVWSLRSASPPLLAEGPRDAEGVWAPPGAYQVELAVDGERFTQPLVVVADPRVGLPPAAYGEQFAFARRIEAARVRVAAADAAAKQLAEALAAARKEASPALTAALDAVGAKVEAVAGSRLWWVAPASVTSLRFVGDALGKLERAVDGADAAPSADARAGFDQLQATLATTLAVWEDVQAKDLAAVNRELGKAGKAPIAIEKPTP